jgi:hypothetical protein
LIPASIGLSRRIDDPATTATPAESLPGKRDRQRR